MRKFLSLTPVVAALVVLLSSCDRAPIYTGPIMNTITIDVPQTAWKYSKIENNNFFYATVQMPEITKTVFNAGMMKMYRAYLNDGSITTQIEMPYSRQMEDWYMDEFGQYNWYFRTEHLDYEIEVGKITIFYTLSDFEYELDEQFVPEAMDFRFVYIY